MCDVLQKVKPEGVLQGKIQAIGGVGLEAPLAARTRGALDEDQAAAFFLPVDLALAGASVSLAGAFSAFGFISDFSSFRAES